MSMRRNLAQTVQYIDWAISYATAGAGADPTAAQTYATCAVASALAAIGQAVAEMTELEAEKIDKQTEQFNLLVELLERSLSNRVDS